MTHGRSERRDRPKFLCDAMLGTLARWLRFFGFDAAFDDPGIDDRELARRAQHGGRWLLTRDRELASVGPRTMMIRSEALEGQLVEVFARLGLQPEATLEHARCGECNGALADVARESVVSLVPPHVAATAERFRRCEGCGRVYWPGSHGERILERMRDIVERLNV